MSDKVIKQEVQSRAPSINDQYWPMIENAYPGTLRVVRVMRLGYELEPEDVVSEITIRLAAPKSLEKLMKLDEKERRTYIYESMRWTVQQLMRRREGLFGNLSIIDIPDSKHVTLTNGCKEAEELSPEELAVLRTEDVWDDEEEADEADELGYEDEPEEQAAWRVGHDTEDSIRFADIDEYVENLPGRAVDPLERIIIAEVTSEMRKVLSDQLWQIVEARYVDDLGVRIIAEQQGMSAQAIQKQLAKAQEILRKHFLYGSQMQRRKISNASPQLS